MIIIFITSFHCLFRNQSCPRTSHASLTSGLVIQNDSGKTMLLNGHQLSILRSVFSFSKIKQSLSSCFTLAVFILHASFYLFHKFNSIRTEFSSVSWKVPSFVMHGVCVLQILSQVYGTYSTMPNNIAKMCRDNASQGYNLPVCYHVVMYYDHDGIRIQAATCNYIDHTTNYSRLLQPTFTPL